MRATRYPPLHTEPGKHHTMTIVLHWGTVICIVAAVSAILLREIVEERFWRQLLLESHRQLGLVVLFCVALRIGIRLRFGMANHMAGLPWPMRLAAMGTHWCLYGLMIGLPLLGWATTNAHNLRVHFLGLTYLPSLARADSELADLLSDFHVTGSWALLGLVSLHASAALYHHFIRRDRVLWAMLPSRKYDALDAPVSRSGKAADRRAGQFGL